MQRRVEGVDAVIADLARQVRLDLPRLLRAFAEEATEDVRARWPVATGASRDALRVEGGPPVAIVCDVEYASLIHEKGLRGPTWLIRTVGYVREHADAIGARAVARLDRRAR